MADSSPSNSSEAVEREKDQEQNSTEDKKNEKESSGGFWEKVLLLVLGFTLTTFVGGFLTDRFRRESTKAEFEVKAMQSDIDRSIQVFENISQLMDKRLFRMRRLHDVFNGNIAATAYDQRLSDYRAVLVEWNDNLNRYRALYKFYFSPSGDSKNGSRSESISCGQSFDATAGSFTDSHTELQKLIAKKEGASIEGASTDVVQGLLNDTNVCVYFLDEYMLERIQQRRNLYKDRLAD